MTRAELIAKLEAATGPSRELDARIALAQGWSRSGFKGNVWTPPGRELWDCDKLPDYTSSIDDALTLYRERPACVSTDPRQVCIAALKAGEKK